MKEYILDEKDYKLINRQRPIKYTISENNCWESVIRRKNNYVLIYRDGIRQYMHRYVYELYFLNGGYKDWIGDSNVI